MKKIIVTASVLMMLSSVAYARNPGYDGGFYNYGGHDNYTNYSNRKWYKSILPPLRTQTIYSFGKLILGPQEQVRSNLDIYYTTPRINNYMPNYPDGYVCSNTDIYKGNCR